MNRHSIATLASRISSLADEWVARCVCGWISEPYTLDGDGYEDPQIRLLRAEVAEHMQSDAEADFWRASPAVPHLPREDDGT
jgi:hypothetical protein